MNKEEQNSNNENELKFKMSENERLKINNNEELINPDFKSGYIGFLGRTNVGKSTILNRLIGDKVSIVTPKKQTTRNQIKGILTTDEYQYVFVDTPGLHKAKTKLSKVMNKTAYLSNQDVDLILYVAEPKITDEDLEILQNLRENRKLVDTPIILIINKTDKYKFGKDKARDFKLIDDFSKLYDFAAIIPMSAEKDKNLEPLKKEIYKNLKKGPKYFADDYYTSLTEREIVEEVVREKALKLLREEIPHNIYVETKSMKKRKTSKGEDIYDVEVDIYTSKNSTKSIIIGKSGSMLKKIGQYAREDLERMLGIKINLRTWVKVRKDWLNNDDIIKQFEIK